MSHAAPVVPAVRRIAGAAGAAVLVVGLTAAYVAPQLSNVAIPSYAIPLQGAAAGTVSVDQPSAGVVVVSLASSNTRVVGVPSGVPLQPGAVSAPFVATGAGAGCARVTATLAGRTRVRHVVVHPASSATTLTLTIPNQILPLGGSIPSSVTIGPSQMLVSASLSSSNPAVASVPATVALTRGSGSFNIAARAEGCATITATASGQTVRKTVQVVSIGG